jgi:hypothetical protein
LIGQSIVLGLTQRGANLVMPSARQDSALSRKTDEKASNQRWQRPTLRTAGNQVMKVIKREPDSQCGDDEFVSSSPSLHC